MEELFEVLKEFEDKAGFTIKCGWKEKKKEKKT